MISILLWIAMQGVPTGIFLRIKPEPRPVSVTATTTTAAPIRICRDDADEDCVHVLDIPQPPEPMDVPAVRLRDKIVIAESKSAAYLRGFETCVGKLGYTADGFRTCTYERWTCHDRSRILLTSEDGVRHCVKF